MSRDLERESAVFHEFIRCSAAVPPAQAILAQAFENTGILAEKTRPKRPRFAEFAVFPAVIRRLSEKPKFAAMDDAKIVRDSVAEIFPASGHGVPEELDDLPVELGEGLVVPVVGDVFVHQAPQPLDGIEMGK